ncbi:MAG: hypothetical protein AB1505_33735 [Candidatus Latescibacterota bacterium]
MTGRALDEVCHIRVHGDPTTYCGHPRQGGLFDFGRGEIAVLHNLVDDGSGMGGSRFIAGSFFRLA